MKTMNCQPAIPPVSSLHSYVCTAPGCDGCLVDDCRNPALHGRPDSPDYWQQSIAKPDAIQFDLSDIQFRKFLSRFGVCSFITGGYYSSVTHEWVARAYDDWQPMHAWLTLDNWDQLEPFERLSIVHYNACWTSFERVGLNNNPPPNDVPSYEYELVTDDNDPLCEGQWTLRAPRNTLMTLDLGFTLDDLLAA